MMVDTKDAFYVALRDRLRTVNPERKMLVRGALRPAILVEDAEPVSEKMPRDVYVLRWTELGSDPSLPETMAITRCEIHYCTVGTEDACGLDRGKVLAAMDADLREILKPPSTPGMNYSSTPATATGVTVFWTEPLFSPTKTTRDSLERVASVTVLARCVEGVQ